MKKLLVFVVLLALGAGAAYHFGYLDRLWPGGARLIPKDPALLAYFSPDTRELLLVQATELNFPLPPESQGKLEQSLRDFHAKTGINVPKDVDALAAGNSLGVVRGRFDWGRLSAYLQSEGYTLTELEGVPAAVRPQAADLALDGRYLLIGPRAEVQQALVRKRQGQGLGDGSPIVKALDDIGWKHAVVGGMVSGSRLADLPGSQDLGLRSMLGAFDTAPDALELRATALTGSKQDGEALHATAETLRKTFLLKLALDPSPEARALREPLEKATLELDPQGNVRGAIRFPYALADQASTSLANLPEDFRSLSLPSEAEEPVPSGQPSVTPSSPTSTPAAPAPVASASVHAMPDWKPPVLGLLLLVFALVTMGAKARPGLFNVLFHPLFLLPFLVSTLGVFVFRWTGHSGGAFDVLALPMPEWHRFVSFPIAQPIALSAAVPMVFAIASGPVQGLRRFAAGLGIGFSAYLVLQAFAGTSLPLIPPAYTLYWYAGNALAALLMARLTIPPRQAK